MRSHFSRVALLLAVAIPATAQTTWTFRSATTNPTVDSPSMTFDTTRGVAVMLGYSPLTGQNQTWAWNGTNWQLRSSTGPVLVPYVRHSAIAFDSNRGVAVFYGGCGGVMPFGNGNNPIGVSNETFEWDGTAWNNTFASPAPPMRSKHAMAFDGNRGVVVMFGGIQDNPNVQSIIYRDTWIWDGQSWAQRNPVSAPPQRHGHAMAYDSSRQRIVLFGGTNRFYANPNQYQTFNDTWEWDGTNWFEVTSAVAPPPRQEATLAYDNRSNQTILFGGIDGTGGVLSDTWAWNGTTWRQLAPSRSPARRYDGAMAFDTVRGVAVLFGGSSLDNLTYQRDTWELTVGAPASYTPYGAGCAGSRGTPALAARLGSLPLAGQTFFAQVGNLPLTSPAFMFLGLSRTQYGPIPLPFDLTIVGMPGCALLASGDFLFPVTTVLGSGTWSFDIPASLAGARFYNQALVIDPVNAANLTVSNGAEAVVGN